MSVQYEINHVIFYLLSDMSMILIPHIHLYPHIKVLTTTVQVVALPGKIKGHTSIDMI